MLAVDQFDAWLSEHGHSTKAHQITRSRVEGCISHVLDTRSSATAKQRYLSLKSFFGWLVDEEEILVSPMAKMRPPKIEEKPPPVLSVTEQSALIAACTGRSLKDRRDAAIVSLLIDSGSAR